jgi:hypothetical protein
MTESEIAAYVDAAAVAQGLTFDPEERARVILQFTRIAAIATPLNDLELPPAVEMAPVFRP